MPRLIISNQGKAGLCSSGSTSRPGLTWRSTGTPILRFSWARPSGRPLTLALGFWWLKRQLYGGSRPFMLPPFYRLSALFSLVLKRSSFFKAPICQASQFTTWNSQAQSGCPSAACSPPLGSNAPHAIASSLAVLRRPVHGLVYWHFTSQPKHSPVIGKSHHLLAFLKHISYLPCCLNHLQIHQVAAQWWRTCPRAPSCCSPSNSRPGQIGS